jgi:protease I
MSSSPVPSISTDLLVTADGELNRELASFLGYVPVDVEIGEQALPALSH